MLEAYSTDVIEDMLAADETLVSVLPDDIAAEVCQHGKLGRVPWDFGWELPPINLIRRREARALVAEEAFASILLECCAGQKRQGPGPGLAWGRRGRGDGRLRRAGQDRADLVQQGRRRDVGRLVVVQPYQPAPFGYRKFLGGARQPPRDVGFAFPAASGQPARQQRGSTRISTAVSAG